MNLSTKTSSSGRIFTENLAVGAVKSPIPKKTEPVPNEKVKQDAALVAAVTGPYSTPVISPQSIHPPCHSPQPITSHPSNLHLTLDTICDWLVELSIYLVGIPQLTTTYMLRFLYPATRKLALTSGISPTSSFHTAQNILVFLLHKKVYLWHCRGATIQPQQNTGDEFALELGRIARLAFPKLPQTDRDDIVLYRFVSGLWHRSVTKQIILNSPPNLTAALRRYRQYDSHQVQSSAWFAGNIVPKSSTSHTNSQ
uniref:Uncharacterized protein n=1 Tax=Schistocephalus solidus TaxID=70667 RepID=A0A0X3PG07_SCHSO